MNKTTVQIINDSSIKLWGLGGRERLLRQLEKITHVECVEDTDNLPANQPILILRGDYLYDPRLLRPLLELEDRVGISAGKNGDLVAIKTTAGDPASLELVSLQPPSARKLEDFEIREPGELTGAGDPRLLKYDPPTIMQIAAGRQHVLEKELFDGSYKGVTDFVTKWLWPWPARYAVKYCVNLGITANQVTIASVILAVIAGLAFWQGYFVTGLLSGWFMTFLDTVDGKLARVTVTSSRIGDIMDHGLDLIHPPFWYLAWGTGASGSELAVAAVMPLFWVILLSYIGGRLCEGLFEYWLAPFRLFLWQPLDSFNRLVTARRNPNMVLLTFSLVAGHPWLGYYLVAVWHVMSTVFLIVRVAMAMKIKARDGELKSWFDGIDPQNDRSRLAVRIFTRLAKSGTG